MRTDDLEVLEHVSVWVARHSDSGKLYFGAGLGNDCYVVEATKLMPPVEKDNWYYAVYMDGETYCFPRGTEEVIAERPHCDDKETKLITAKLRCPNGWIDVECIICECGRCTEVMLDRSALVKHWSGQRRHIVLANNRRWYKGTDPDIMARIGDGKGTLASDLRLI